MQQCGSLRETKAFLSIKIKIKNPNQAFLVLCLQIHHDLLQIYLVTQKIHIDNVRSWFWHENSD